MSATETSAAPAEAPKGPVIELIPLGQNLARPILTFDIQDTLFQFHREYSGLAQQLANINSLQQRIQAAYTTVEKEALAKIAESEIKDFTEKDALFLKRWKISVAQFSNRRVDIIDTGIRLFTPATEEEVTKAKQDSGFKPEHLKQVGDKQLLHVADVRGFDFVTRFKQFVRELQGRRDVFIQVSEALKRATSPEEKAKLEELVKQAGEQLEKGNKEMAESVGYSILRNYEIEILEAKFIAFLNQEELNQVVAAQQQQAAAAVAPAAEAPKLEKKADKKN
jgi:hypothetical protein